MTKLVFFMLLSAAAAPSVRAGDTKDSLRDVIEICNQFIINDPDPGIRLDYHNDCDIYDDRDAATGLRRVPGDPVSSRLFPRGHRSALIIDLGQMA